MRIKPREIILTYKRLNGDVRATAKELGIHHSTVYRWLNKAKTGWGISSRGLHRKPTKPKSIKKALGVNQRVRIEELRNKYGWDAQKICAFLNLSVSSRTVHRFLKRKGLVGKYGYHRRPRFQDTTHMHAKNAKTIGYLQMDVKYITPELSGLPWTCFEYGVIDIFSRYKEENDVEVVWKTIASSNDYPYPIFDYINSNTCLKLETRDNFNKLLKKSILLITNCISTPFYDALDIKVPTIALIYKEGYLVRQEVLDKFYNQIIFYRDIKLGLRRLEIRMGGITDMHYIPTIEHNPQRFVV